MSNQDVKNSRNLKSLIDPDSIYDKVFDLKKKMEENLNEEDAKLANEYFNEITKGLAPTIKRMNEVLSNEGSRLILIDTIKQAMKDEQWLEKLSQTSYKAALGSEPETK